MGSETVNVGWKDLSRVMWGPTLKLAFFRGISSGLILATFMYFSNPYGQAADPVQRLLGAAIWFVGWSCTSFLDGPMFWAIFKAVGLIANPSSGGVWNLFTNAMLLFIAACIAVGDPLLWIINLRHPGFLPVQRFGFFNLRALILVFKDDSQPSETAPA